MGVAPIVKTYYELLSVESAADTATIKTAFRREIARYHPDKVTHLGREFQDMASTRAAELTAAYKILTNPELRAEYDASVGVGGAGAGAATPPPRPGADTGWGGPPSGGTTGTSQQPAEPVAPGGRFEEVRAGRDDIIRVATLERVGRALQHVVGECLTPRVRGFDLACIPKTKTATFAQFFRKPVMPAVLVRLAPLVDGALATETWTHAMRVRLADKDQPIALLLIGNQLASASELAKAIEEARRKSPESQDLIFPVPIDLRDWSAKIPLNAPETVRSLVERLKSSI